MMTKIVPIHHVVFSLEHTRLEKFACGLTSFHSNCFTNVIELVTCKNCIRSYQLYAAKKATGKDSLKLRKLKARYGET